MLHSPTGKGRDGYGFTVMEVLVVIGIIAVVVSVAIPSLLAFRRSAELKQKNDYARSIFLAAQTRLTELRSADRLEQVAPPVNHDAVPQNGDAEGTPPDGYSYITGGDDVFDAILPVSSVDAAIRDDQIIIEYNPRTGNVYSVFYYEGSGDIAEQYRKGDLARDGSSRKKNQVGYYVGSDLTEEELPVYYVKAAVSFENGQEGLVYIDLPTQYTAEDDSIHNIFPSGNFDNFVRGLTINLTVTGQRGGEFKKTVLLPTEEGAATPEYEVLAAEGGVTVVRVACALDSLIDRGSFASIAENVGAAEETVLTSIENESAFEIVPGENVTITAEVSFEPGPSDPIVIVESAAVAGVNPMFDSLTMVDGGYVLTITNGRNLQNLNALAPSIAAQVKTVAFTAEVIDWQDTVDYYNKEYPLGGAYSGTFSETPARGLPYFVPVYNAYLFDRSSTENAVVITGAEVIGNGCEIYNLNIDTTRYTVFEYYVGADAAYNTGLFGCLNTAISDLYVVNPVVRSGVFDSADGGERNYHTSTGALIGAAGSDTVVTNCGVYIDTEAEDYVSTNLDMSSFDADAAAEDYGVSGIGAVGGLVGYADQAVFENCFAAMPVYGKMTGLGDTDGVGGFVGNSQMSSFQSCYASGYVGASGCVGSHAAVTDQNNYLGLTENGTQSRGVGGFVGTGHGTAYTDCFAAGDVGGDKASTGAFIGTMCYDSNKGAQKTKFTNCYAVGSADASNGTYESFAGVNAVIGATPTSDTATAAGILFDNSYYLSGYYSVEKVSNNASRYCAESVTYQNMSELKKDEFGFGLEWTVAAGETHSYDGLNAVYPFTMLLDLPYYGNWPSRPSAVGVVYYEEYRNYTETINNETIKTFFYYDRESTSMLRQDQMAENDGYAVFAASSNATIRVNGKKVTVTAEEKTADFCGSTYYMYKLTDAVLAGAGTNGFYTKVEVTDSGKTYTMYFNPNVALSQVNPTEGNPAAAKPDVPSKLYIRSARQLAALGSDSMKNFVGEGVTYTQQLDIQFGANTAMTPIENFNAAYIGRNADNKATSITGLTNGIFESIGAKGSVRNLNITLGAVSAMKPLFGNNSGTVESISVTAGSNLTISGAGLLVGTNSGTIKDCTVNVRGVSAAQGSMALIAGTNGKSGVVTNVTAAVNGTIGGDGFVRENAGTIESCIVSPVAGTAYAGQSNTALTVEGTGFAGTNSGTIRDCAALGSVTDAGFVGANKKDAVIERCFANVDMAGGTGAFAGSNEGTVRYCYGWVKTPEGTEVSLKAEGDCISSYFANRTTGTVMLYGKETLETNLDILTDASYALEQLNSSGNVWYESQSQNAYPYTTGLGQYPYPMLREHYGDWKNADGSLSYGVLYYEQYSDNTCGVTRVNLSGVGDTTSDKSMSNEDYRSLSNDKNVVSAGYALYCKAGSRPFSSTTNNKLGAPINIEGLHSAANLSELYGFYELDAATSRVAVENKTESQMVYVYPEFGDSIQTDDAQCTSFQVRCQEHLENIADKSSDYTFEITGSFIVDSSYQQIPRFSGTLSGSDTAVITADGMTGGLIDTMAGGTLSNIRLTGSMTVKEGEVAGSVADTVTGGTLSNVTTDVKITADGSGTVGLFAGSIEGGTFTGCTATNAEGQTLHFAGEITGTASDVAGATHTGMTEVTDGDISGLTALSENETAKKYAFHATFTDCTYVLNGTERNVLETQYLYQVTELGGYKAGTRLQCRLTAAAPKQTEFASDVTAWTATGYYIYDQNAYYRVYVQVETVNGTNEYAYKYIAEEKETELTAAVAADGTISLSVGETVCPIYKLTYSLSDSADYVFVDSAGKILTMNEAAAEWVESDLVPTDAVKMELNTKYWTGSATSEDGSTKTTLTITYAPANKITSEAMDVVVKCETTTTTVTDGTEGTPATTIALYECQLALVEANPDVEVRPVDTTLVYVPVSSDESDTAGGDAEEQPAGESET